MCGCVEVEVEGVCILRHGFDEVGGVGVATAWASVSCSSGSRDGCD